MSKPAQIIPLVLLALLLASCAQVVEPTLTASATPPPTPATPTHTATPVPVPPSSTPTVTPSPTPTPTPTPIPTPTRTGIGWDRYPNALDFRAALPLDDALWLASSSGLVRVDWSDKEWTIWTEADGLVDNTLVSLAEQGDWLWIGTQGGVSRYDRKSDSWRAYTTDDGLASNHNVLVYNDGENIWAGTRNGLSWYDPAADNWESLYTAGGIDISGVDGMLSDGERLWISVSPHADTKGGLLRLDLASGEWTSVSREVGGPPFSSHTLAQSDELLWSVPRAGLPWQYSKRDGRWRQVSELDPDGDGYTGAQFCAGALWLYAAHAGELIRLEPETHQVDRYPAGPLSSLMLQGQIACYGEILLFTGQNGLLVFELDAGEWRSWRWGEKPNAVHQVLGQQDGALLVSSDLGVGFWEPATGDWQPVMPVGESERLLPDGASLDSGAPSVWLIEQLHGAPGVEAAPRLLLLTEPGVEPQRFELVPPADWSLFQLLPESTGNTLWFAGSRGFVSYSPAVDQWGIFELDTESFNLEHVQQHGHLVWFITDTDLGQFDTNTGTFYLSPLPVAGGSQPALAVTADAVWLLVDGLLYRGEPDGSRWVPVDTTAYTCLSEATRLAYWSGALWLGGVHGVGRLEEVALLQPAQDASNWECYTPAEGMLDAEFEQIIPTDDALWFSHRWFGLWRYTNH